MASEKKETEVREVPVDFMAEAPKARPYSDARADQEQTKPK